MCSRFDCVRKLIVSLSMRSSLVDLCMSGLLSRLAPCRGDLLSADFARLFKSLLQHANRLCLYNNLRAGSCIAPQLANCVRGLGGSVLPLTELSLAHTSFLGDAESIAYVIDAATLLTRLDLTSVRLNGLDVVLAAAARHGALRVLEMNDCRDISGRSPELDVSLVALLKETRTLEVLRCANSSHQPEPLLNAIADAPSLRTVDISAGSDHWVAGNNRTNESRAALVRLLERNSTLHVLRCPDAVTISESELNVWEESNFSLYHTNTPVVVHGGGDAEQQTERFRRLQTRNRRIHEWIAMRERVLEVAVAMGELRLPPYVLELVIDSTDHCMHMTRHWNKIRVLIAVQKFQNQKSLLY
jgi:hypothetical protein